MAGAQDQNASFDNIELLIINNLIMMI